MSQNLPFLCSLLIEDIYGVLLAQIFLNIAKYGRQPSAQIAKRCRLPPKQLKNCLPPLVALRLVYQHTDINGLTTYQANTSAAYNLLRIGKILNEVRNSHGQLAAQCVSELLACGYATLPELLTRIIHCKGHSSHPPVRSGSPNVVGAEPLDQEVHARKIRVTLQKLVDRKFIVRARHALTSDYFDARREVEVRTKAKDVPANNKGKKSAAAVELDLQIESELADQISTHLSDNVVLTSLSAGQKRTLDETRDVSPVKRRKLQNGSVRTSTAPSSNEPMNDELEVVVCVNFQAMVRLLRSQRIVETATKKFGSRNTNVLKAVLEQIPLLSDPWKPPDPPCSLSDLVDLDLSVMLRWIEAQHDDHGDGEGAQNGYKVNGVHTPKTKSAGPMWTEILSIEQIEQSLSIMGEGPFKFISYDIIRSCWTCDNRELVRYLQDDEIQGFIRSQVGQPALRLIRMLQDKGRLDEKCIQEFGLLNAKELRQTLAEVHTRGFLHIQEVPRDPQRQPNRTIFLWFYDSIRVRKHILEAVYKIMTKLLQRMMLERERLSSTLGKAERNDVKGSEEDIFGTTELQAFRSWQRRERWFIDEISRLDDLVTILRDI